MSKPANPNWVLSSDWAVVTNPYNWILYRDEGKAWRAVGYYPTPEKLLICLFQKLTLQEQHDETLEQHVNACLEIAQAAAAKFLNGLAHYPSETRKMLPVHASRINKEADQ